ncbi:sensor histidine kinase [Hymenobacter actinosclerus]|uniref:histidine kinase n=1 Tax=Hymenobacter actinosclerus TaxID=82805 RepID=A0A1I0GYK3_9BACT|nr:ATP-binding protein [Hymenobacter actinosclerus]SET76490.1 His Kinase A (phospho-acceptor) domain-containing protein [Hymenobacter actinosclerus]
MAQPTDTIRIRSKFYSNDIVITKQDSNNATVSFVPTDSTESNYRIGPSAGKKAVQSGGSVFFLVVLSIVVVRSVSRFADLPARLPRWSWFYVRLWMLGGLYFLGLLALRIHGGQVVNLYLLLMLGSTVAVLALVRDYRPARTLLVAFLPWTLHTAAELLMSALVPNTLHYYRDEFDSAQGFSVLWLIAFAFVARSHKRQAEKERLEREAAALEKQRIEAQNAVLEQMVAERTATLTRQAEELRETLEELRVTQDQLIQSEKMASLGELTAGIAHEIQNPLNFVTNFADVSTELLHELEEEQQRPTRDLALETELLTDLRQNLTKITHHGQRAASIVRGMLEHSRASTGERLPTDLNQLADEYLRLAYHGLRAKNKSFNAKLTTFFDPQLKQVEVVPQDLGRVLLNLFTNAFYAVQQRQLLGEPGYAPTVEVNTLHRASGEVEIRVRDNGTGIPEAVRQKIFQPFFTTKPAGQGTGLGLSLSYDIITKSHNGTLSLETEEGQGTEFIIELPG